MITKPVRYIALVPNTPQNAVSSGNCARTNMAVFCLVIAADQADEFTLDLDAVGSENPGLVCRVGGF